MTRETMGRGRWLVSVLFGMTAGCSLNPQPLPPDSPMDGGGGVTVATPTVGDAGQHSANDAAKTGLGGGEDSGDFGGNAPDAGEPSKDASLEDASASPPDGGPTGVDAALDGPPPLDGSPGDAAPLEAGPADGAPGHATMGESGP